MLHGDAVKYKSPDIDAAVIFNSPLKWVAREASKPSRAPSNTWCLLASPSWSEAHMEDSVQDVANALLAAFEDIGGIGGTVWTAHRWRYAVTASALLPLPPTSPPQSYPPPTPAAAMWNGALGIGVCGDWCHSSHAGTVEGAWLSARTLAENVITSW
jgi:predicted NAD/FAD-dependent oxidoreductase